MSKSAITAMLNDGCWKGRRVLPSEGVEEWLDAFELKPNMFGFGVNLNEVIRKVMEVRRRRGEEKRGPA